MMVRTSPPSSPREGSNFRFLGTPLTPSSRSLFTPHPDRHNARPEWRILYRRDPLRTALRQRDAQLHPGAVHSHSQRHREHWRTLALHVPRRFLDGRRSDRHHDRQHGHSHCSRKTAYPADALPLFKWTVRVADTFDNAVTAITRLQNCERGTPGACATKALNRCAGALGVEFVLLNFQGDGAVLGPDHGPARDKLQRGLAIQLRRPTDGHFHFAARQQYQVRGEQESGAAHVDGLAGAQFIRVLPVAQNFEADFSLDREP